MKYIVALALLLSATGFAAAQDNAAAPAGKTKAVHGATHAAQPLPVVIPQQFAPPQEEYASQPEPTGTAAALVPSACQLRLAKIAVFKPLPMLVGAGECGAVDAVLMDTVILPDQSKIAVAPAATMRCPMAEQVALWVREDVVPALKQFGQPLRVLDNFDSYECRGRNRVRAAQLSEHGKADALDVRDFKLADGHELGLTDINVDKDWRVGIRASACARFSTVLGPGSDGYHEEHIHLDLAERRNNYKVCEWDVREPPPPPAEAQAKAPDAATPSDDAAPEADTAAQGNTPTIPLDMVPIPRPRPKAANKIPR